MGFFSNIIKSSKKVKNKNVMEAIIAASLLVAAADGDISKQEILILNDLLANNDLLSAFKPQDIKNTVDRYSKLLVAGFRVGKVKMLREIADIADNAEQAEEVFVTAITIAEADGTIEKSEMDVLKEIGTKLGLSLSDYGL